MGRFSKEIMNRKNEGVIPVIPDFKRISPKEGELFCGRNPVDVAVMLAELGAPVFSVVTENEAFGGSLKLLEEIVKATGRPVLRKDFIKSKEDLKITKDSGADAILLICSVHTNDELIKLFDEALRIGLEPFLEAKTPEQLAFIGSIGARLVGINNRDILELERDDGDVSTTERLSRFVPSNVLLISESGIFTKQDVNCAIKAGADAVLVGTAIWKADDMRSFYLSLCGM